MEVRSIRDDLDMNEGVTDDLTGNVQNLFVIGESKKFDTQAAVLIRTVLCSVVSALHT